jgi:hypothetical protein
MIKIVALYDEGTVGSGITLGPEISTAEWHLEKRVMPDVVTTIDGTEHVFERISEDTDIGEAFRHTLELTFKPIKGSDMFDLIEYLAKSTWFNVYLLDDDFVIWHTIDTPFTARVTTNVEVRELFKADERYYGGFAMTLREQ